MSTTTLLARERWQRAKEIVSEALDRSQSAETAEFVTRECAGDNALLREVQSLLAQTTTVFEQATPVHRFAAVSPA